eukprot:scaffold34915_cov180-Amphora_coffeaeformis.AAC.18
MDENNNAALLFSHIRKSARRHGLLKASTAQTSHGTRKSLDLVQSEYIGLSSSTGRKNSIVDPATGETEKPFAVAKCLMVGLIDTVVLVEAQADLHDLVSLGATGQLNFSLGYWRPSRTWSLAAMFSKKMRYRLTKSCDRRRLSDMSLSLCTTW